MTGILTMHCQKFQEYLYPDLDGELDENLRLEMEKHLLSCPVCSLEFDKERKFGHILKTHLIKEKAPFALRESVIQQLEDKKKKFSWRHIFVTRFAPALALLAVITMVIFHQQGILREPFPVFSEALKNHLEYLKGEYPLEFQTSDLKEALDWFQGKTDFAVTAPHLSLDKVKLVGGRVLHLKDKKTAYLLLKKDGYKISVFYTDLHDVAVPKASSKEGIQHLGKSLLVKTEKGYRTVFCFHKDEGTACIFVSDMPLEELEKLLV